MHRRGLARLHAQRARRPDLRLSRLRALRAAARPSLQPSQALARSLCQAHRRRAASVRCALRLSGEFAARRPLLRSPRQRAGHAEGRRHRRQLQLGRRPATQRAVVRHGDLRGPCARAEHAAPGPAAQRARHLRGTRRSALHRPHQAARRHRGRADAGQCLRAGPQPPAEGPAQLLGLQHHRLLRPRAALPVGQHARRDAHRRPPPARRRHRADPRRRLQPYRRGQRAGTDHVVPRPRQCQLLPPRRRQSAPLRQRHRHRQHGEPRDAARAADGDGFAALLGHLLPCRWLPFRPRRHPRPRGARFRSRLRLLRRHPPGPGAVAGKADLRAVGHRPGRLPARQPSAGLRRMERPVSRRHPPLLARRRGPALGFRRPPRGVGRLLRQAGRDGRGRRSTTPPATTASPWPTR